MKEDSVYNSPSPIGTHLRAHTKALEPTFDCPVDKCFAIERTGYNLNLLREIATERNCVVIEHEDADVFEIRKVSVSPELFYRWVYRNANLVKNDNELNDERISILKGVCLEYVNTNVNNLKKYGVEPFIKACHAEGIIPYSYIQRRLISQSAFKNYSAGPTKGLKYTIGKLIEQGFLSKLSIIEQRKFSTKALLLKIN